MSSFLYTTFSSPFNTYTIVWKENKSTIQIQRLFLSGSEINSENKALKSFEQIKPGISSLIEKLNDKIQSFLQGNDITFNLSSLDFNNCFKFQKEVLLAEYEIPRGYISTYKRIAKHLRNQNAARVVGNALAKNPFPIIIPCHRAIKSDGNLGGFQGGIKMKRSLLEMEGFEFTNKGKVIMNNIFY
jgi:methylated-DNA-[protein]-cysteine S-methyltransferase